MTVAGVSLFPLHQTSVYVEKCIANMNASGIQMLAARSSSSVAPILTALANLLTCKSAPSKIAAQKTLQHFEDALGVSLDAALQLRWSVA